MRWGGVKRRSGVESSRMRWGGVKWRSGVEWSLSGVDLSRVE